MEKFVTVMEERLEKDLSQIEKETSTVLQQAEQCIAVLQQKMSELRSFISGYSFKSDAEEISFFKEVEPRLHARLLYYVKVFQIETRRPKGSTELQKELLQCELRLIHDFFARNLDFYRYYASGATHLDHQYFRKRQSLDLLSIDEHYMLADSQFCTAYGYKIACILAYESLQDYLKGCLEQIDNRDALLPATGKLQQRLEWSCSKSDLTELAYALYCSKALNKGEVGLYKIVAFLESLFNIELGDYRKLFRQMRMRKKNRTGFLDKLRDSLSDYMDQSDEQQWN